jgi:hypothetical protein
VLSKPFLVCLAQKKCYLNIPDVFWRSIDRSIQFWGEGPSFCFSSSSSFFSSMTDLGTTTNDQTEKDWTTNIPVLPLIFESVTCKIPKSLAVSFMTCPLCEQRLKKVTTITSCLHRFCEHCIKIYLQRVHMNCPICGIRLTSLRQLRTDVEYGRLVQELDKVFS